MQQIDHIHLILFFLNPYEIRIITSYLDKQGFRFFLHGGDENSERKVVSTEDSPICSVLVFKINVGKNEINHRDILGSLISLGMDRDWIGDIILYDDFSEIAILNEKESLIRSIDRIRNFEIFPEIYTWPKFTFLNKNYTEISGFVTSLRLDNFISLITKLSRSKANSVIKSGSVKVNFIEENSSSKLIEPGDEISIRGIGRFVFKELLGKSKSDRLRVKILKRE